MLGFIAIVLGVIFYASILSRVKKLEEKVFVPVVSGSIPVVNPVQKNITTEEAEFAEQEEILPEIQPIALSQDQITIDNLPAEKSPLEKLVSWLADEWPLKTGIFLLILAVGWFITYAFINDWIGEVGRVSLGVIFGTVILFIGYYRSSAHQLQGNALLVLGAISILISIISGIGLYDLFPATVALAVAFALVVFMALSAWQQKKVSLGVITLLMGSVVPLFVFSSIDISIIFLYLFMLSSGTLWISSKTGWNSLNIISLTVVFLYSVAYESFEGFDDDLANLIFAFAFIFLFYLSNIFTILHKRSANVYDLVVSAGTGLLFLIWMLMIAPKESLVYLIVFGAFLFAVGAYLIFIVTKFKNPIILYAAVSLMLLVSATAIEFKGWELTVAYTVEFSLFIIISLYLKRKTEIKGNSVETIGAILYAILFLLSLSNIEKIFKYLNYKNDISNNHYYINKAQAMDINSDLLVLFLLGIMAFVITVFVIWLSGKGENKYLGIARFYGIVGGFYAVILTWIMTHLILTNQTSATMLALIIYTVVGVGFYAAGKKHNRSLYKSIGGILFGIVLFRLFLFEFANMDMVGKIITFFVVGVLFVSTTFIGGKSKNKIDENN